MIWLIGSKTLLGVEIARKLDEAKIDWIGSNSEVNVLNVNELNTFADSLDSTARQTGASVRNGKIPSRINWVINCLSSCPDISSEASLNIARTTRRIASRLIHFSSDIVYRGDCSLPYKETDVKDGVTDRAREFALSEDLIEKEITQYYILRLSSLYGYEKGNYIYEMLSTMSRNKNLKVCKEIRMNPVSVIDAASVVLKIIESSRKATSLFGKKSAVPYGVYNLGSSDDVFMTDFARKYHELCRKKSYIKCECQIEGVPAEELPASETKGPESVLDVSRIQEALRIKLPSWLEGLEHYLKSDRLPRV